MKQKVTGSTGTKTDWSTGETVVTAPVTTNGLEVECKARSYGSLFIYDTHTHTHAHTHNHEAMAMAMRRVLSDSPRGTQRESNSASLGEKESRPPPDIPVDAVTDCPVDDEMLHPHPSCIY